MSSFRKLGIAYLVVVWAALAAFTISVLRREWDND